MDLKTWVMLAGKGAMSRLARESGIAWSTVHAACHGRPVHNYRVARALSDATGGAVTLEELCAQAASAPARRRL